MPTLQATLKFLKENGYKLTKPRKNVLEVLTRAKKPLSAYDIQKCLPEEKRLEAVSIYRILDVFESLGIIHKVISTGGYVTCSSQGRNGCHHFLICDECQDVQEIILEHHHENNEEKNMLKKLNFIPREHVHEIQGVCKSCIT